MHRHTFTVFLAFLAAAFLIAPLAVADEEALREKVRQLEDKVEALSGQQSTQLEETIEQYLDDVQAEFAQRDVQGPATLTGDQTFSWITPPLYARWYGYMDKAESLAVDEPHKKPVRMDST